MWHLAIYYFWISFLNRITHTDIYIYFYIYMILCIELMLRHTPYPDLLHGFPNIPTAMGPFFCWTLQLGAVECRYNVVQYCKISHKKLREVGRNINQMVDPQKTPNTSPVNLALTGVLWGVFCDYVWENWPRYNGTALH